MKVHFKTLGCRLNEAEVETWAQTFQKSGYAITNQIENANLVVLNTCAVTQDATKKSRQIIRRIHRDNPNAKLVVSGCYATLDREKVEATLGVDLVVSNNDKELLVEKALVELNLDTMPEMSTEPGEISLFKRGRQRAFVKVQDGCRYKCTFCIVTIARGEEVSRPVQEIISEINKLAELGVTEIILTGVHLGGYGSDLGSNLPALIKSILAGTEIPRIRLGSLEPWELSEDFIELFQNPRIMPHLHLPLQSGSDSVLRRMARRCKTEEYTKIVSQLRSSVAHFNVTTDIIVGFPGETEQEWQESYDFIRQTQFGHIHIFTYSGRAGTKAAEFPNQIMNHVKKERSQKLHELAEEMKEAFNKANIGQEFAVLWEGYKELLDNGKQRVYGYSPNYLRVAAIIDANKSIENMIIQTKLKNMDNASLNGELLG